MKNQQVLENCSFKNRHRSISLSSSMVEAVEAYIKENPEYRSIAAFFEEAARIRLQELKQVAS